MDTSPSCAMVKTIKKDGEMDNGSKRAQKDGKVKRYGLRHKPSTNPPSVTTAHTVISVCRGQAAFLAR